ncbi:adenine nucleotide alpha hydrolases-like protein [Astrocystis sublimbata]|nr:adenine nucleotide alpha hydrolases-like protein [Astrocystis sublimbata]
MGTLSHVLHTGARPISIHEFAEALRAISPPRFPTVRTNIRRAVGMAISGGVDSMALAYLCSQLHRYDINFTIADNPVSYFRGTIVDHRLRPGSTAEANNVAKAVRAMGFLADIAVIRWDKDPEPELATTDPNDLPNIESLARRLRYQKIGTDGIRYDAVSYLFGHHQDDQYETVLMRLLQGHGARGLRGIQPASNIPECEGMFGVHGSGWVDDQKVRKTPYYDRRMTRREYESLKRDMRSRIDLAMHEEELQDAKLYGKVKGGVYDFAGMYQSKKLVTFDLGFGSTDIEDGGIVVYRPLLEFPKERLIATCEANKIPWWEDETNKDPTLTMRNTVRHMCRNHTLPVALQKDSILALSKRCAKRVSAFEAEADRLLTETIIHDLEPNVGSASVQFPEYGLSRFPRDVNKPWRRRARIQRQREVAGLLIKKIVALVSPEELPVAQTSLQNVITWLFPALSLVDDKAALPKGRNDKTKAIPKAFNVSSVHFVPIPPSRPAGHSTSTAASELTWYLSRAPYPTHQPPPHYRCSYWAPPGMGWHKLRNPSSPSLSRFTSLLPTFNPIPPTSNLALDKYEIRWTRWGLWDGRFWVRVRHQLPYRVVVLPFLLEHAKDFRESLAPDDKERLGALLKRHAPGKTRFTLPALYLEEKLDFEDVIPRPYYPIPPCDTKNIPGSANYVEEEVDVDVDGEGEGEGEATGTTAKAKVISTSLIPEPVTPAPTPPHPLWNVDPTSEHPRVLDTSLMRLVALPTLDVQLPRLSDWLQFEIRYRRVDRDTTKKSGSFSRGSLVYVKPGSLEAMNLRRARAGASGWRARKGSLGWGMKKRERRR